MDAYHYGLGGRHSFFAGVGVGNTTLIIIGLVGAAPFYLILFGALLANRGPKTPTFNVLGITYDMSHDEGAVIVFVTHSVGTVTLYGSGHYQEPIVHGTGRYTASAAIFPRVKPGSYEARSSQGSGRIIAHPGG